MSEPKDHVERALELLVFVPLGAGLYLRDTAPAFVDMFVARGRAELDRRQSEVQQRVTTARSLGQVAMAFGPPLVRQRVQQQIDALRGRGREYFDGRPAPARPSGAGTHDAPVNGATAPTAAPAPAAATTAPAADPQPAGDVDAPPPADLPIPGYDALSASQVVERLTGLSAGELDTVRAYESAHRRRRTILGKIEQLSA